MLADLRKIFTLLLPGQRRSAAALLGLMLLGATLEVVGVGLMIPVIALMIEADIGARYPALSPALAWLGHPSQEKMIIGAMLGLIGIFLAKNLFLALLAWRQARFAFGLQCDISQRLFAAYLHQPYAFHLQNNSAKLIYNTVGTVSIYAHSAVTPAMLMIAEGCTLLGIGGLALMIEPVGVMIVALLLSSASVGFHWITRGRVTRWGRAREHHERLRTHQLMQGLGAVKEVRLLGRESHFLDRFHKHSLLSAQADRAYRTLQHVPRVWLELMVTAGLATLVVTMIARGQDSASIVPTVGYLAAAAFRLIPSANRILGAVQSLRYSQAATASLAEELKLAVPEGRARADQGALPVQDAISLHEVSFTYAGAHGHALDRVSLTIRRGESVGLIGPSGSGKSTLVDLLLGLLTPTEGQVRVDGRDIQDNLRGWQDQVGYVPQVIYLTDDTLRRNVALGLPDDQIDEASVNQAIRAAHLGEFVSALPAGLDTVVGERGVRLSGGQRQRIGIARALYRDPAVLVLDEATSSLDATTERSVMEAVATLQGKKTVVIVAHRVSTIQQCDRLYRLERGVCALAEGRPLS